jgi:outer membrane lipoprotein SlyB
METQTSRSPHPLVWVAAIALIVFCGAGIAAIMGWLPGSSADPAQQLSGSAEKQKAAPAKVATAPAPAARPAAPVAVAAAKCADCGVIQSVREIESKGPGGSGIGVVGGALVGGLLGNQVGDGNGQKLATVIGAVGGAVAGNEIEKRVKKTTSYEITVRLDDGTTRAFTEDSAPSWRSGDKVRIVNGRIQSNA